MTRYEEIVVGDMAELEHCVTELDVARFVEMSGDDNRLHTDPEFAKSTAFGRPVVHGMVGASFISTVIGTKLPGDGALWFSQTFDFLLPVRVGDVLRVCVKVLRKFDRDRVIELETLILNQHRQVCTSGTAKVRVVDLTSQEQPIKEITLIPTALVLGATGGIGRATCLSLAQRGFDVIVHGHTGRDAAEALAAEVRALGRQATVVYGDILEESSFKAIAAEISRRQIPLTSVIHCAVGSFFNSPAHELSWEDFSTQIDLHVKSAYLVMQHLIPILMARKYGKVVFITSQSVESPVTKLAHYITAKSALNGFAKGIAMDLAVHGVRVNLVSPGMTKTPLISSVPQKAQMLTEASTPLRRLAMPEDVAKAIVFLASNDSDYLTGETIRVNGGQVML